MDSLLNMSISPSDNITESAPEIYKTTQTAHLVTMMKNMKEINHAPKNIHLVRNCYTSF